MRKVVPMNIDTTKRTDPVLFFRLFIPSGTSLALLHR